MSKKFYVGSGLSIAFILVTAGLIIYGQQQQNDPKSAQRKMDEMNERGDHAMGFDHLKTTHHFILTSEGGSIQVEANDESDKVSRDQIRMHLRHIATMFSEGNFAVPMLVHDETPPGTEVMRQLKNEISYRYEEIERGASVRISTKSPEALAAVHEFLRYQIKEHQTGDPLELKPRP
jgi:hypothetical protein